MATANSSRFQMYYVEEDTPGTQPVSPAVTAMRIKTDGLNYNLEFVESEEIRSDRQTPDLIQVGADVSGGTDFELSYGSQDDFLQAALFGTWSTAVAIASNVDISCSASGASGYPELISDTTDFLLSGTGAIQNGMWILVAGFSGTAANNSYFQVLSATTSVLVLWTSGVLTNEASGSTVSISNDGMLQNGTTERAFTFEKYFTDITKYQAFNGCEANSLTLDFASKSVLGGSLDFLGTAGGYVDSATIATSTVAANSNKVFNAVSHLGTIRKDNAVSTLHFKTFALDYQNNLEGNDEIGTLGYFGIRNGTISCKTNVSVYLENGAFFNDAIDETEIRMDLRLTDTAGNVYILTWYAGKISGPELTAGSINNNVMNDAEITWYKGSTIEKTFQIDKIDA